MIQHTWDDSLASSTAPIFDHAVYLSEALGLPGNQHEDDLDAELALLARASGIQDPYQYLSPPPAHDISRALSTITVDSDHRSSISIHSQETHSTGFTSAPSRTSRDHVHANERSPAPRLQPQLARASVSVENYSTHANAPVPAEPRRSASTLSVAQSVLSSSSSLQQQQQPPPPSPRRKRSSALFAMFRKDPSSCTSRAHHGHHGRSRGTKLECGHALSTFDIRVHIQDALKNEANTAPNCCGKVLPRSVLEAVLTKEETDLIINGDLGAPPNSLCSDTGISSTDLTHPPNDAPHATTKMESPCPPVRRMRHQEISVDLALANEAFKNFKTQQKEQFERVTNFECTQRKALVAHHQRSLQKLKAQHEASREDLEEEHLDDLERLEEKQLNAEHDLREAQMQETKNIAIALKFMEGYCLDTNIGNGQHARTVTEEDFRKLDRQRKIQQTSPQKQQNSINVLRARQERETKRRLETQEAALEQMDVKYKKELVAKEAEHKQEMDKLDELIDVRRKRLLQRWDLKFEIWRRDWEDQHQMTLDTKLEHEDWPSRKADHAIIIADSSSLAQYVKATA